MSRKGETANDRKGGCVLTEIEGVFQLELKTTEICTGLILNACVYVEFIRVKEWHCVLEYTRAVECARYDLPREHVPHKKKEK